MIDDSLLDKQLKFFKDRGRAKKLLSYGHGKIIDIHDRLSAFALGLMPRDFDTDNAFENNLSGLLFSRANYDRYVRRNVRKITKSLRDFESDDQISCLSLFFDKMPEPNTESFEEFSQSLLGNLVIPKIYISQVSQHCYFMFSELNRYNQTFGPIEFRESVEHVLGRELHNGGSRRNFYHLRKLTLPGCYGTGHR